MNEILSSLQQLFTETSFSIEKEAKLLSDRNRCVLYRVYGGGIWVQMFTNSLIRIDGGMDA